MNMRRQSGFTLIELMVVIAILGILGATAVPVYNIWLQRAYGREATIMVKQIIDGQILYNLEHDSYYPCNIIIDGDSVSAQTQQEILDVLKVAIPTGHPLNYQLVSQDPDNFYVYIWADFALFKEGDTGLWGQVDGEGEITIFPL